MFHLRPYQSSATNEWDALVRTARNATFLFERAYMDYHADRFYDASLLIYDEKNHLRALFPATWHGDSAEIRSHGGLTYGGLLLDNHVGLVDSCEMLRTVCDFYRTHYSALRICINPVPSIYHEVPADDLTFALCQCGFQLSQRYAATTIALDREILYSHNRKRQYNKAIRHGFVVRNVGASAHVFWQLLAATLQQRHGVKPVHNAEELALLMSRFPQHISLHIVEDATGNMVGGTLLYHTPRVVHAQYIAATQEGRKFGALDLLFIHLLQQFQALPLEQRPRYFDFGTSMEEEGRVINAGLVRQKEGFGGHTICYDKYVLHLS